MQDEAHPKPVRHHRGREIPWLRIVRFHKEVVARAEQGFFSLDGRNDQADRWTSLEGFAPCDLGGPWIVSRDDIRSRPFLLTLEQGQHDSMFLGGPCFLGWSRSPRGKWMPQWRPLLYREVALAANGDDIELTPQQGNWNLTPLLYGFLDRMEVDLGVPLDEFCATLIEAASRRANADDAPIDQHILHTLCNEIPGAEEEFARAIRQDVFEVIPTPWVLFAPTSRYSALTRHLMQDYERLESILTKDEQNIGGLRLLEDQAVDYVRQDSDVLPVVALNQSQRRAVQRILERHPLTVISGPPGTGKSQVVVALLLNAWAAGKTVLFASNNNKAVDVVRERVERFESEFPIAVRAGAKQRQNIQEILRRTLNMASVTNAGPSGATKLGKLHARREKLLEERTALLSALESELPQRIDEARKTALRAYGKYRSTLGEVDQAKATLCEQKAELGFASYSAEALRHAMSETSAWLNRVGEYRELVTEDERALAGLERRIANANRLRNQLVEEMGLPAEEVEDWRWLLTGPSAGLLADWRKRFVDLIEAPIEQALEHVEWEGDYDRWRSMDEARAWSGRVHAFAEAIRRTCAELAPRIERLRKLSADVAEGRREIAKLGLSEDTDVPLEAVRDWTACFAEIVTRERGRFDFLPWSSSTRLEAQMQKLERRIRPVLPLSLLKDVGTLNEAGRTRLAPVVEKLRHWLELRREWNEAQPVVTQIEDRFRAMRSEAGALGLDSIPSELDTDVWLPIAPECERLAGVAHRAALAWKRRSEKEDARETLRGIAREWVRLAGGIPLREAWRRGQGRGFDEAIRTLGEEPNAESVAGARQALYSGRLSRLIECWQGASEHEAAASRLRSEVYEVPDRPERIRSWWAERPAESLVLAGAPQDQWPEMELAKQSLDAVASWCKRWDEYINEIRPQDLRRAEQELDWALSKLDQAITILPEGPARTKLISLHEEIRSEPENDWPISRLNQVFEDFSPDRIRGHIERIEAELERGSFEDAKERWLVRLQNDDEAIRAVDALEKSIRQHKGQVAEDAYSNFRTALRAVPVWITTAQASQAIPLEPELFDMVVIDEASQCTLTNLLPLMYRGRTLAVIGDDNQLPAIPTIQETEELALAKKHDVEEHLSLAGHAANDVYRTATESLPRRRADVIMLEEHFRSHPQIIGFSNRHVYLQRLELKKDPGLGPTLPIGSGVHSLPVIGSANRGENGRSWLNILEADAVLDLVQKLKQGDSRSLSIGVVTPFAAQKNYLREKINLLSLASEVLVDTAYGFQGDERDVIVFSPVVAKGITSMASRWVESPPNLINVAVTRAREALFVVGDLDYCLQQEGILRKLALYCRDIQLLRKTSPAELELFSWMVVKGWEPRVHPRIGDIEVDFVLEPASAVRLAIEVDGRQHREESVEQDRARDAYLMGQGYEVVRLPAREVMETPFDSLHRIESKLRA